MNPSKTSNKVLKLTWVPPCKPQVIEEFPIDGKTTQPTEMTFGMSGMTVLGPS